jgi:hypothetical protein
MRERGEAVRLVDLSEYRYLLLLRFLGAWWCLGSSLLEPYVLLPHLATPDLHNAPA